MNGRPILSFPRNRTDSLIARLAAPQRAANYQDDFNSPNRRSDFYGYRNGVFGFINRATSEMTPIRRTPATVTARGVTRPISYGQNSRRVSP